MSKTFQSAFNSINSVVSSGNWFSGSNILWVDDEPPNNADLQNAMQLLGASVTDSLSTDDALAKINNSQSFNLVISDMARPGNVHAGIELLKKLRSRGITTPYIVYSSTNEASAIEQARAEGAFGVTNTPTVLMRLASQALGSGAVRWTDTRR